MKPFHKKLYRKRVAMQIIFRANQRIAIDIQKQQNEKESKDLLEIEATKKRVKQLAKKFTFKIPEN